MPIPAAAPHEGGGGPPVAGTSAPASRSAPPAVAAPLRPGAAGETLAALDLGTNNCRLLIARTTFAGFRIVDAFSRIVRLGEGMARSGMLAEPAMARTIEALRICAAKMVHRGVARGRYVATEACRRAVNCADFLERVRVETGLALEIIATEEEARLVVGGCASLLDRLVPHAVVFDIGGGSTEIVWVGAAANGSEVPSPEILGFVSVPHGVVSLTERYGGDLVSATAYEAMVEEVRAALLPFEERHGIGERIAAGEVQMLGSSGTVTTLAGIHLRLPRYNRSLVDGTLLGFTAIEGVSRRLAGLDMAARAAHPCVGTERADLVVAGCAILEAICETWPVGRLRVADRGVREGILLGLAASAPER